MIAVGLGVLGLLTIGLGVASATAWRAADTLVATASATRGGTLVTTAPGVLETGRGPVTVHARGGGKVVLAIGREGDVKGWVGTDAHRVVTGLADLRTLETTAVKSTAPREAGADATAKAAPAPDPDGSDMWVQQSAGKGAAELTWIPQPGRWTLLVASAGEGAAAPSVVLSWQQQVTTPWLVPGIVLGAILLFAGVALAGRPWLAARRGAGAPAWHCVETGALPVVASTARVSGRSPMPDDAPTIMLTRRQMRAVAAGAAEPAATRSRRQRVDPGPQPETELAAQVAPTTPVKRSRRTDRAARAGAAKAAPHETKSAAPAPAVPAGPSALPTVDATSSESRADAWRRSWGFPEATDQPDQTGRGPSASQPGKDA